MAVRILVVDDDRAVRESLRRSLAFNGYSVALAEDGVEALETNWGRADWSTCVHAGIRRAAAGLTGHAASMNSAAGGGLPANNSRKKSGWMLGASGRQISRPFSSLMRTRFSLSRGSPMMLRPSRQQWPALPADDS